MDSLTTFTRALDQTGQIIHGVSTEQLSAPTPCDDWDLRELLNHTIGIVDMFNDAAQGKPFDPTIFARDNVGSDPAAKYDAALTTLRGTLANPGVLDSNWVMPFGELPGTMAASFSTLETFQHGWDVARASGQSFEFDPDVTEVAFATARMLPAEQVRRSGVYGDESSCPSGAPAADQLAAFLGRTV
jgi:uncharacterized protein (TIGR03086 family)